MTVEELIHELKQMPGHYHVLAFHEGYEVADFEANLLCVERAAELKRVDLVVDLDEAMQAQLKENQLMQAVAKAKIEELEDQVSELREDLREAEATEDEVRRFHKALESARSALRVIHTWAVFQYGDQPPGHALDPKPVAALCDKKLKETAILTLKTS